MNPAARILLILLLMTAMLLYAQEPQGQTRKFPAGLSLAYGIGSHAHTDEYISREKYSGSLPTVQAGWTNRHDSYVYHVGMEFGSSSEIKNANISSTVTQFSMRQGFLYPLPGFSLLSGKANAYVGPSTGIFVFTNKQHIAVSGFDYAQSIAALISLGLDSRLICPLSDRFNIESSLNFSVLSLGVRMVDMEENDESPVKLLTLFSGLNGSWDLGIRFFLSKKLSIKTAYLLGATRISSWDPLYIASDNLILMVTYEL
ncbi:hypothetical protein JW906_15765 [bacterium]|nr:hypothetical protein [bacterium]